MLVLPFDVGLVFQERVEFLQASGRFHVAEAHLEDVEENCGEINDVCVACLSRPQRERKRMGKLLQRTNGFLQIII